MIRADQSNLSEANQIIQQASWRIDRLEHALETLIREVYAGEYANVAAKVAEDVLDDKLVCQ